MSDEIPLGTTIAARFLVESVAGQGGMGTVYRALDRLSAQPVALKVLHAVASSGPGNERFQREARLLSELRHPNIVSYITHGHTEAGQPFLVMEWLDGEDLSQRLLRERLSVPDTVLLIRQVASGLRAAHDRGIVHRDLKPSNIFLRGGSIARVALLDFGVARRVAHTRRMTRTGLLVGTPEYMAPEQARGTRDIGPPADIFSLGCVLFECLSGHPPFIGEHLAAVLAKILFGEPPTLRSLGTSVPQQLGEILARMLRKEPSERYPDAGELCQVLAAVPDSFDRTAPQSEASLSDTGHWGGEHRQVSLVMASQQDGTAGEGVILDESHPLLVQRQDLLDGLLREAALHGAQAAVLTDGSLVVSFPPSSGTAMDQAAQAVHSAQLILRIWPAARVAVTTGRADLGQRLPAGDALTRAGQMLIEAASFRLSSADILVDSITAGLLGRRFCFQSLSTGISILSNTHGSPADSPLLFGHATPFLGREQDLATLDSTFAACVDEENTRAVLVTGAAGIGKSRLVQEFLERIRDRGPTLLFSQAEPVTSRSPYALIRQAVRRLCGLHESDPVAVQFASLQRQISRHLSTDQQRVLLFMAELCEIPMGEAANVALRAARQNPRVMDDQITRAFLDWLRAESAVQPVLIVLDDVQFADPSSVQLIETLLRTPRDGSLMLVAMMRHENTREPPRLWREHVFPLPLAPLSKRSCEKLILQSLGEALARTHSLRIVELADGNPLFLEELIRAVAEGKEKALPATVLAMVQARLDRLDGMSRRVLRAASVFGERFWPQGLQRVLGLGQGRDLELPLNELLSQELIVLRRDSRFPNHPEYAFRHSLIRDVAYAWLTDQERQVAHGAAAVWLEQQGEQSARLLAEHFRRAEQRERAVIHYVRAAEQSFSRNDLDGVFALAEQGYASGARGAEWGSLLALRTLAHFFCSDMQRCLEDGSAALATLQPGRPLWYQVVGAQISAAGLTGQNETLKQMIGRLRHTPPDADARAACAEAMSSVTIMYGLSGARAEALQILADADALIDPDEDADVIAHGALRMAESMLTNMLLPDPFGALRLAEAGISAFRIAGDRRQEGLCRIACSEALYSLGESVRGEQEMREALQLGKQLAEPLVELLAVISLGLNMALYGDATTGVAAERLVMPILEDKRLTPVYRGHAHCALAGALLVQDRPREAEQHARKALSASKAAPVYSLRALALLIMSLRDQRRSEEAAPLAEEGLRLRQALGGTGRTELRFLLAVIEMLLDLGRQSAARELLFESLRQLEARAARIPSRELKQSFLVGLRTHVRLRELAQKLTTAPS